MSLFSEFDLFRRSVQSLFSDFERDFLNDRYLIDTHFQDYPLLQQADPNDDGMQVENQNSQDASKANNNNTKTNNNTATNNNTNTNVGNQLQGRGVVGGLINNRPLGSSALLFSPWSSSPLSLRSLAPQSCRMDVIEKKDHYEVHAELAGIPKENIKIEVNDGLLTLSGEHRSQIDQKANNNANINEKGQNENKDNANSATTNNNEPHYHYRERSYASVKRSLRLPENIDSDKISARFDNGLLEIVLPKKEKVAPKPINIQIA